MRNIAFFLFAFVVSAYTMTDVSVPKTFADSGKIYASDFNQNYDTLEVAHNRLIDTIDIRFIRFTDLTSGDTTLRALKVDSIKSNPRIDTCDIGWAYIDSIRGVSKHDTLKADTANITKLRSGTIDFTNLNAFSGTGYLNATTIEATVGSLNIQNATDTAYIGPATIFIDSIYVNTYGIYTNAKLSVVGLSYFDGNIKMDTDDTLFTSLLSVSKINADSIKSNPSIDSCSIDKVKIDDAQIDSCFTVGDTLYFKVDSYYYGAIRSLR